MTLALGPTKKNLKIGMCVAGGSTHGMAKKLVDNRIKVKQATNVRRISGFTTFSVIFL